MKFKPVFYKLCLVLPVVLCILLDMEFAYSQTYGLKFNGYDFTLDKRTELNLTPDEFLNFRDEFEISFDYKTTRIFPNSSVGFLVLTGDCYYPTFGEILAKRGYTTEVYGKFHSPEHMARVYMNPPLGRMTGTDPIVRWILKKEYWFGNKRNKSNKKNNNYENRKTQNEHSTSDSNRIIPDCNVLFEPSCRKSEH